MFFPQALFHLSAQETNFNDSPSADMRSHIMGVEEKTGVSKPAGCSGESGKLFSFSLSCVILENITWNKVLVLSVLAVSVSCNGAENKKLTMKEQCLNMAQNMPEDGNA